MAPTPEQQQAITEEGKNIIVSAGAGSGKTAVLKAVNELISIVDKGLDYENFQPNRIKRCSEDKQYTEFELVFWKYGDKYDGYTVKVAS